MPSSRACRLFGTALVLILGLQACSGRIHGNDLATDDEDLKDENVRIRLFHERHGTWPDPKWLEWEKPGYTAMMDEKAKKVMAIKDRQERWQAWNDLTQARMVPRFTENQWEAVDAPEHIHKRLLENFHRLLPSAGLEEDKKAIRGGSPKFLPQEELNYEILEEMTPLFENWVGMKLEPTSVYGVRLYQEGQTLDDHLDVLESHVVSGILHIDSDLDEPFPIQIDNSDGTMASLNLRPGQLMFYESAKSVHGRTVPMKGRYYGSIFMHYRPIGWNMTRRDVKIAIPPYWADGVVDTEPAAEEPEAPEVEAGTGEPQGFVATFENTSKDIVWIQWLIPDSESTSMDKRPQMKPIESMQPGSTVRLNTMVGHTFFGTRPDGSFTKWVIEPRHETDVLRVFDDLHQEL